MPEEKKNQQAVQTPPAPTITEMEQAHAQEIAALQQANQQRYTDLGQIVSEAETKLGELKQQDETAKRRSNAFRYIAGIGDTLSGLANVIGTGAGAQNQQQTYNGNMVAEKAEASRRERKLEMDQVSTRLDEMRARQREMKTAGSLAEAELKARQAKDLLNERIRLDSQAREDAYKKKQLAIDETNAQANLKRAEASETNAETKANNPTTRKPDKEHTFELVGGQSVTIPAHKWTDTAITSVYSNIPDNMKTKRQRTRKNIAGIDEPEVDASGNPVYHTPTRQEMLNDIVNAAKTDRAVADALRKYAGTAAGANDPEFE